MDLSDAHHAAAVQTLARPDLTFVVAALALAEVLYFVGIRLGTRAESGLLRGLSEWDVQAPAPEDWNRIGELVEKYGDFPLGGVDASIVALAERLDAPRVLTFDYRHFRAIRPSHCEQFELLP